MNALIGVLRHSLGIKSLPQLERKLPQRKLLNDSQVI